MYLELNFKCYDLEHCGLTNFKCHTEFIEVSVKSSLFNTSTSSV
jgi:hypothetical protein